MIRVKAWELQVLIVFPHPLYRYVQRARATTKASSTKRQEVINKRRPGLVITKQTAREVPVKVRSQRTSALRVARKAAPVTAAGKKRQQKKQNNNASGLDVSNIQRHFREHPSKFDLPKDTNLRITIKYALYMLLLSDCNIFEI